MKLSYFIFGLFYTTVVTGQEFRPDTTVNNIRLENGRSFIDKFKRDTLKIWGRFKETGDEDFPFVDFQNQNGTQILKLIFHPGNWTNRFSEFKIQYAGAYTEKDKAIRIDDKEFVTEKGIKLGTSKTDLIKRIGKPTTIQNLNGSEKIEYRTNDEKSNFLRQYGKIEYFAIYTIVDGKVNEFHFGFIYP